MERPKSVSIMGRKFKIQYTLDPKGNLYGEMDSHHPATIKIRSDLEGAELHDTLLHECIHAVLAMSGQNFGLRPKQEESLVLALEMGLGSLVTLNLFLKNNQ